MGQQPRGERVGLPISKHVDRAMGGHVDQHGAVDMPAAAARNRPLPAPSPDRSPGRGAHGSTAAARFGSSVTPAHRPVGRPPGRPRPARSTRASGEAAGCAAHGVRSVRGSARRTSEPNTEPRRRRSVAPEAGSRPGGRQPPHRPAAARTGCGPATTLCRSTDTTLDQPSDAPRSAPIHRPHRAGRSPHPPDAAAEPATHPDHHTK